MKNCLIVCGGEYAEHEISILSARFIATSLDTSLYNPVIVIESKYGGFFYLKDAGNIHNITACYGKREDLLYPCSLTFHNSSAQILLLESHECIAVDIAIPMIHGLKGEDGSLQGLLEYMNIPYLGCDVISSSVCMDKIVSKALFQVNKLPCLSYIALDRYNDTIKYSEVVKLLKSEGLFIKSSINGSSVGCFPVSNESEYLEAIKQVKNYGFRFIIEPKIDKIEVECSIFQSEHYGPLVASKVGEIHAIDGFYSYKAKYIDLSLTKFIVPSTLPESVVTAIQDLAKRAFSACLCSGMARVDFFVCKLQKNESFEAAVENLVTIKENDDTYCLILDELNSLPGFTVVSLYPSLLKLTGIEAKELLNGLLREAQERFDVKKKFVKIPSIE